MTQITRPLHVRTGRPTSTAGTTTDRSRRLFTRRALSYALAVLWLLDGALQLQSYMFTSGFAHQIIAPAASGQPGFIAGPVRWNAALIAGHPVALNALFAAVQLALGVGFLFRRTVPIAIVASVAWAGGVWVLGEGLGGLLGGTATALIGAPGAAVLYAVLAVAAWPGGQTSSVDFDRRPAPWTVWAWAILWLGYGALSLLPANRSTSALVGQLRSTAGTVPGWLGAVDRATATALGHLGAAGVALTVALELAVGILALSHGRTRTISLWLGMALAALYWMVGQSFGLLFSGQATDPNAGPLVILLGLTALAATSRSLTPGRADRGEVVGGRGVVVG